MDASATFAELLETLDVLLPLRPEGGLDEGRARVEPVSELLAYLARRMTGLSTEREAEAARFLAWLGEQLDCAIDDLQGKTTIYAWHEQTAGVDSLLGVLQRNHARTGLNVSRPRGYGAVNPARERIIDGYERSMAVLRPIRTQIQLTDRLIDLIVYRLYGLTREEAALVDERTT